MVLLSEVVERHQGELERLHGSQLMPSHRQALQAMRRCRRRGSDLMVLHCSDCSHSIKVPHSCEVLVQGTLAPRHIRKVWVQKPSALHKLAERLPAAALRHCRVDEDNALFFHD